jgi:hypothetical protein
MCHRQLYLSCHFDEITSFYLVTCLYFLQLVILRKEIRKQRHKHCCILRGEVAVVVGIAKWAFV